MLSLSAVGTDIVLQVRRKFPPSSAVEQQLFTQCNSPVFTKTAVSSGCYVINPTVGVGEMVGGCLLEMTTAVVEQTWGGVKALYKD